MDLKVKALERIKHVQVIEARRWVSLNLLQERCDVCFVLKRQLEHRFGDSLLVKVELELDIANVVLRLTIIKLARILSNLEVICYLGAHIFPCANTIVLDPRLQLGKSATGPQSRHDFVSRAQEDADQASAHCEMIILKSVPFRLGHDLARGRRVDNNFVPVYLGQEARAVLLPHLAPRRLDQIGSLSERLVDKFLRVRRVTHTLEELDTLFSL